MYLQRSTGGKDTEIYTNIEIFDEVENIDEYQILECFSQRLDTETPNYYRLVLDSDDMNQGIRIFYTFSMNGIDWSIITDYWIKVENADIEDLESDLFEDMASLDQWVDYSGAVERYHGLKKLCTHWMEEFLSNGSASNYVQVMQFMTKYQDILRELREQKASFLGKY